MHPHILKITPVCASTFTNVYAGLLNFLRQQTRALARYSPRARKQGEQG